MTLDDQISRDGFYHEVSAPFVVMRAYMDMFAEGRFGPLTTVQQEKILVMQQNMRRAVAALREYSKTDENRYQRKTLNPAELLQQVQKEFFLDFERRGLSVVVQQPGELPAVNADPDQTLMVIQAVLGCCLYCARYSSTLTIQWQRSENELSLLFSLEPDGRLEFCEETTPRFWQQALEQSGLRFVAHTEKSRWQIVFTSPE